MIAAEIAGACLGGADLVGADLVGADLVGADLAGADLTGADLAAVAAQLCDRSVVIAVASDAVIADAASESLNRLQSNVRAVASRLADVARLAEQMDRLADPLTIGIVE